MTNFSSKLPILSALSFACLAAAPLRAQCPAATASEFKKETLVGSAVLKEPIELSVAKNGMVFVVQRGGDITLYNPATGQSNLALHLDCYLNPGAYDVGGPLGVAVAPDFPTDPWVYIYWVPASTFTGGANNKTGKMTYRLSRFRFAGSTLDANSEQILFEVPSIWETHNAGSLKFGKNGDLYLSTGDNHAPGCSDQYSPMDERAGNSWCDDQGTTANTNDLRGKILRIHPEPTQVNGKWYSIPAGNLKEKYASLWPTPDLANKVRPEIYTMGHRNPYRIFPDPVTGKLFIAENGPASGEDADRGPAGADQWKVTDEAAFLGYPYFLKNNQPYCHWDYAQGKCVAIQGQASLKYDINKPVNYSPNNTGVNILPPAKPAALWEHDGGNPDPIAGLKACGPGAGPVYHFDASLDSKVKFPKEFDGKWLFHAIMGGSGWQPKYVTPPSNFAPITSAQNPPWGNLNFTVGLHDMEFGPGDGALYVVDYGSNMYNKNSDAGLFKVTYNGCQPPVSLAGKAAAPRSYLSLPSQGGRLAAPVGARGAEVYDIAGKKLWESALPEGAAHLTVPGGLAHGMLRVLWK